MKKIYKYEIGRVFGALSDDPYVIDLPFACKIIKFGIIEGKFYLWALIDDKMSLLSRSFRVAPTGRTIEKNEIHIETIIDGVFVWHLLEVKC